jgi:hypothetical protein
MDCGSRWPNKAVCDIMPARSLSHKEGEFPWADLLMQAGELALLLILSPPLSGRDCDAQFNGDEGEELRASVGRGQ